MKKYLYLLIIASYTFTMQSCDYINNPIENTTIIDTGGVGFVQRKVLIEDYTGHKCTACPQAAIVANNLIQTHGDKVVVIAVHAGFFSTPSSSGTNYLTDFRTASGTAYNTFFGFSQYPSGLINRKYYPVTTTTYSIPHGSWSQETTAELAKPASAKIEITNVYDANSRGLTCDVKTTFLYDTLTGGPYKLIVLLTQDSIIATQLDGSTIIPNYLHRHVLRDNLSVAGTWGDVISNTPVTKNTPITKTFNYVIPNSYPSSGGTSASTCDVNNCHVVAFLYNTVTKEVIQVEEKKVIP